MSERIVYLVSYDVSDDARLRRVYQICRGYGDHVQLSVFLCELSPRERAQLVTDLDTVVDHVADQVLLIDLGPAAGRAATCIDSLGRPFVAIPRRAVVV